MRSAKSPISGKKEGTINFETYVREMKTPEAALVLDASKRIIIHSSGLIALPFTHLSNTANLVVRKTAYRYHTKSQDMPCHFLKPTTESKSENQTFTLLYNHPNSPSRSMEYTDKIADGVKMFAIVDDLSNPGRLQLRIAKQSHYAAANGQPFAYAAGFIRFDNGKIISITNDAGGYHLDSKGMSEEVLTQNLIELYASTMEAFKRCGVSNELFMEVFRPTYASGAPKHIVDRAWETCKRLGPKVFAAFSVLSTPDVKESTPRIPATSPPAPSPPVTHIKFPPITPISGPPSPVVHRASSSAQTEERKPKSSSIKHSASQRVFTPTAQVRAKKTNVTRSSSVMPSIRRK